MYILFRTYLVLLFFTIFLGISSFSVVHAGSLPVVSTVLVVSEVSMSQGVIIVAQEETGTYRVSTKISNEKVYGVVAEQPPLVFSTGEDEIPVITQGVAYVQVNSSNGNIQRGDVLVTSITSGVAMRASESSQYVFAIALEEYTSSSSGSVGLIQAEIGADRAGELFVSQYQTQESEGGPVSDTSFIRKIIAGTLVVGALFFVLYSFRSTISQGVISVGRNPRAKHSIMTLSLANIMFAVLLCGIVIFIAVAILILPL